MSKRKNDIFEYEKQWKLFKGNEYMFHLLRKMRPKISCKCPKSYLDYQKMPKNTMLGVVKEHDLIIENRRLKRKLHKIQMSKSTINSYIESYPTIQQMHSHLKNSQKTVSKNLERNQILLENMNMFRRITESKSFFSALRNYSNTNRQNGNGNNCTMNNWLSNNNSFKKKRSSSTATLNIKQQKSIKSYRDIRTNNMSFRDNSFTRCFFDYNELNKELIRKDTFSLWLHRKNIYIQDYGLVCVKLNYQFSKLTMIIDSFNKSNQDTYLVIISDYGSLFRIPLLFKSFDELLFSIKYDQIENAFVLKKNMPEFKYAIDKLSKEKKEPINTRNISDGKEQLNSKTIT